MESNAIIIFGYNYLNQVHNEMKELSKNYLEQKTDEIEMNSRTIHCTDVVLLYFRVYSSFN